jgi:DNA-directed RNA polymerase specialized sigma24 family protein
MSGAMIAQQIALEPTDTLLEVMKWRDSAEDLVLAKDAFRELCRRLGPDVQRKCKQVCARWKQDPGLAPEIANRTFEKFWNANSFDPTRWKDKGVELGVKLYLYRIASNILFDLHEEETSPSPYDGSEHIVREVDELFTSLSPRQLREAKEKIDGALKGLTDKHKVILLTYKKYETDGRKLPRVLLKKLRDELQLTQNTVRFYKKEAFEQFDKTFNQR